MRSLLSDNMRTVAAILGFVIVLLAGNPHAIADLPPIVWWHLIHVVDERTLILRSDEGETNKVTLACIGRAKDNSEAVAYITRRLRDQKLTLWPLETSHTNWYARPMCLILDMDLPGRGGDAVHDFPLLNEELLAWGRVPFHDVKVTTDPFGLKGRLVQAKVEAEKRQQQRQKRLSDLGKPK